MGCYEYGSEPWVDNDDPFLPQPESTILLQNYPNPFNPSTTICYSVPKDGEVNLAIYNAKGQLINTLISGYRNKGNYQIVWQGKDAKGSSVASGLYFTRLVSGGKTITKKMLLMK